MDNSEFLPWRVLPDQIRAPSNLEEADAALKVVRSSKVVLEDKIKGYEEAGNESGVARCRSWLTEWDQREAQILYFRSRLSGKERADRRVRFLLDRLCYSAYAFQQGPETEWSKRVLPKVLDAIKDQGGSYEDWLENTLPLILAGPKG